MTEAIPSLRAAAGYGDRLILNAVGHNPPAWLERSRELDEAGTDRLGSWRQTYTGRKFWTVDPRPEDVNIDDIAHALALENRYGGHSDFPWSVAAHSINVATRASQLLRTHRPELSVRYTGTIIILGLLHDAAEAYVKDLPRPLKLALFDRYKPIEERTEHCIHVHFGIGKHPPLLDELVKVSDRDMLATEQAVMMPNAPQPWTEGMGRVLDEFKLTMYEVHWTIAKREWRRLFDKWIEAAKVETVQSP